MLTYAEAVGALNAKGAELATRRKFDLAHMRILAQELGDPQRRFRSVLIAGTNGKGSSAATLASIANAAGVRTGLYTSPHLTRVNERICISDGYKRFASIGDEPFAALFEKVEAASRALVARNALPHEPSFFETVTAMAFCAFADAGVELAILEAGLGGRLDATNIVDPLLSILTDIDYDHMEWLGDTLAAIAWEKCGILREGGTLVTLPQHPEVNQAIGEYAVPRDVRAISAADFIPTRSRDASFRNRYEVQVEGVTLRVDSPLNGQHQQRNIALAIAAAVELRTLGYKITAVSMEEGIRATEWPARLELMPARRGRPAILLDVAHNPAGAWTLRAAIRALTAEREGTGAASMQKTLIFGCLADKPVEKMAQILFPIFAEADSGDRIVFTRPRSPRAVEPSQLAALARGRGAQAEVCEIPSEALELAFAITPVDGMVIAAGSVYLAGELRPLLLQ